LRKESNVKTAYLIAKQAKETAEMQIVTAYIENTSWWWAHLNQTLSAPQKAMPLSVPIGQIASALLPYQVL
jgi:hypothetical protein